MQNQHPVSECEKEPIHIPGSIQPFGVLLTVSWNDLVIENVSENCATLWNIPAGSVLGRPLGDFMLAQDLSVLRDYLAGPGLKEQSPLPVRLCFQKEPGLLEWELSAYEHAGTLYLELEAASPSTSALELAGSVHLQIRDAIQALQRAGSLQELCDSAVAQLRMLTGFDRVMIYRFDHDWHGEVVAEARHPDIDSYLGHHFPASDIPSQARAIFLQNWLRMIPDISYRPSRIEPGVHAETGMPLDLSKSMLRSVSPVHLEYLRNMGVQASLTISLINEGQLWGLITCHHATPLLVDSNVRISAQLIGQIVSSQIRIKSALDELEYRTNLEQQRIALVADLGQEPDFFKGLLKLAPALMKLAASQGVAIGSEGQWILSGKTPAVDDIERLASWLIEAHPDNSVFHTYSLSEHFPEAARYRDLASGLLTVSVAKNQRNFILWFRPEQMSTVTWAGNPHKPVEKGEGQAFLHPRASFQSWQEVVRGKAPRWKHAEIDTAHALRVDLLSLALQREFEREQQARKRAERLSREKEEMMAMVSHDLRTPLNIATMSFEFLQHSRPGSDTVVRQMLERGARATRTMERLITDLLDVARIEAGTLPLDVKQENAAEMVNEAVDFAQPLANEKHIELSAVAKAHPCIVPCEKNRVAQVLSNLIGNALKFTPAGGKVMVSLESCNEEATFCVADTGPGIPAAQLEKIFDRFWQAEQTRRLGSGLGLSIAKGIVERHKGRIWAESEPGAGARFYFTIPKRAPGQ